MPHVQAQRRLVKSPPELWAELSDPESLARHLGEFGEIRITRKDPEKTVAWEGECTSGTVEIAGSGWGTRVTLTVSAPDPPPPPPPPAPEPEPEPAAAVDRTAETELFEAIPEPVTREPEARRGFLSRLFPRRRPEPVVIDAAPEPLPDPEPMSVPEPVAPPEPEPVEPEPQPDPEPAEPPFDTEQAQSVLDGVLDDLGSAHHRPFSRNE